jgi:hypothetical protein
VPELDESALARQAAALYGAEHHEVPIRIEEIRDRCPTRCARSTSRAVDGPNTYFVSEAAAEAGLKVAVSGVGRRRAVRRIRQLRARTACEAPSAASRPCRDSVRLHAAIECAAAAHARGIEARRRR